MQRLLSEKGGDREVSSGDLLKIYQAESLPAFAGVRGTLHEISALVKEHIKEQEVSLGIQEVTANIAQVATVAAEITQDITDVHAAANELNQSSTQVQGNASDLKGLSGSLEQLISGYKIA